MDLGSTDTSVKADGKRGMTIGDSPAASTERGPDGKLGKSISSSSSSTSSNNTTSNVQYDVLDPVTNELIATTSTSEEATKISMETGGYIKSKVGETSKVGVGTVQTALNPISTGQAPTPPAPLASTATGSNTMGSMRDNLTNEQIRLEETRSKESNSSASVAMVNAPSSSSTVVNNSNFSGGTMSPTDNTDRTYGNYKSSRR